MMAYTLDAEKRGSYLYITVTGENSPDTVMAYLSEIRDLCIKYSCPNVLVVENLAGPSLSTFNVFDIISKVSESTSQVVRQVGYVDLNPNHDADRLKFAENLAVNRGVFVNIFQTIQEAEKWFERQADPGDKG
jgi:hypothetical protein